MVVLRLILVLTLAVLGGLVLAWAFTKDKRYLNWASRGLRFLFVFLVITAVLFIIERLILI
jgi:Na+-driven multidrug efflux pump